MKWLLLVSTCLVITSASLSFAQRGGGPATSLDQRVTNLETAVTGLDQRVLSLEHTVASFQQSVQSQIDDLQAQVDALSGASSELFSVRDANGVQLGNVIGIAGVTYPIVVVQTGSQLLPLQVTKNRLWGANSVSYYAEPGCAGPVYIEAATFNGDIGPLPTAWVVPTGVGFDAYLMDEDNGPVTITALSYRDNDPGLTCRPTFSTRSVYPSLPVINLAVTPPFTVRREGT